MYTIEKAIYDMLQKQPFFANFLLASQICTTDPKIERAACSYNKNQITFYFNPTFMETCTVEQQVTVMAHEIMHILLEHCTNRSYGHSNKEAKNIAMDCAINQFLPGIENIPGGAVTLRKLSEICKKDLFPFETYEYYYEQIKEAVKNENKEGDHDKMDGDGNGEMTDGERTMAKAHIRDQMNKAIKAAAGNIPNGVASIIAELNKNNQVSWKQQLRNLVSSARTVTKKSTRMKVHRRFELEQPGKKKDRKLVLGVCTDSSGSVSDEAYASFMTEIYHIAKLTEVTYLIQADCEVQKVDVIRGGKAKKGVLTTRAGRGGTAYQPAINECIKRECDAIVFMGDFDCADTPKNPGVPFIWVGVGQSPAPGNFGKVLRLK